MKFLLLLGVTVAAFLSNASVVSGHFSSGENITDLIHAEGYPTQNITVETNDGYLLDIIRIPGPPSYKREFTDARKNHQRVRTNKPAVLLMHGLLGSADDFIVGGRYRGLAYKLAENGYDVFLGSARGSRYGRKHTHLNPEKDAQFWNFCWHNIGMSDLPAIIDKILEITDQEKIHYIGHNQGSTAVYVLASQKPEYNSKIDQIISLSPLVFMKHARHPLMSLIIKNRQSPTWITKNLGKNEFSPSNTVKHEGGELQSDYQHVSQDVSPNNYFLVNGYSKRFNSTLARQILSSHPGGASIKQLLHYAQLIKSGRFAHYRDVNVNSRGDDSDNESDSDSSDNSNEAEYDLSKVTTDNCLIYLDNNMWYNEKDIDDLANKLPNVVRKVKYSGSSSNADLLIAKDAHHYVHNTILECLPNETSIENM